MPHAPATHSLHDLRCEYRSRPFDEKSVGSDPIALFKTWFAEACAAEIQEPNGMSLATADSRGRVSCRTVLLKAYGSEGFVFFTNYESQKARQINENPQVAVLFPWLALGRQVEVQGTAEKISHRESLAYFLKRPFKSRIGAWVSAQSSVISSRKLLEAKFEEMCRQFVSGDVPLPPAWGGYRVVPDVVEFWQGGANRLHDRLQFSKRADGWQIARLAP